MNNSVVSDTGRMDRDALLLAEWTNVGWMLCEQKTLFHNETISQLITTVSAEYVALQTCFWHPSLIIYFFSNPTYKLKLGLQIGGRLLIANQLDRHCDRLIKNMQQQSDHIYYTVLCRVLGFALPFTRPQPNRHVLTFLHPIIICRWLWGEYSTLSIRCNEDPNGGVMLKVLLYTVPTCETKHCNIFSGSLVIFSNITFLKNYLP